MSGLLVVCSLAEKPLLFKSKYNKSFSLKTPLASTIYILTYPRGVKAVLSKGNNIAGVRCNLSDFSKGIHKLERLWWGMPIHTVPGEATRRFASV